MKKVMLNGHEEDFEACVNMMDDEIREEICNETFGESTEQDFIDRYAEKHFERYGENFEI